MTAIHVGFLANDFFNRWLWSFVFALPVLPVALLLSALIERMLGGALAALSFTARRLAVSAIAACLIELSLATAVTWSNLGLDALFGPLWLTAFLKSLPIGVVIAVIMNFIVKPRYLDPAVAPALESRERNVERVERAA